MTPRDATLPYRQMLDASQRAIAITDGRSREDLDTDDLLDLAVVRLLEILGEAANRIPKDEQALLSGIPWAELISLRNRLIHGYDSVDLDVVWEIVTDDLPPLVTQLKQYIAVQDAAHLGE